MFPPCEKKGLSLGVLPSSLMRKITPVLSGAVPPEIFCSCPLRFSSPITIYSLPSAPNVIVPPLWLGPGWLANPKSVPDLTECCRSTYNDIHDFLLAPGNRTCHSHCCFQYNRGRQMVSPESLDGERCPIILAPKNCQLKRQVLARAEAPH